MLTKAFSLCLKERIIKTVIWSTLLYGAETWTLKKEDVRRLERVKDGSPYATVKRRALDREL